MRPGTEGHGRYEHAVAAEVVSRESGALKGRENGDETSGLARGRVGGAAGVDVPGDAAGRRPGGFAGSVERAEFWKLIDEFSEPNGNFRSDNLLSNEIWFQTIIPELVTLVKPGAVYLGVGPEQNFSYIAALKPRVVFIVDIRRGNLHTQLMYKALFELARDRADFVSMLFARKRPEGLECDVARPRNLHRRRRGADDRGAVHGALSQDRRSPDENPPVAAAARRPVGHRLRVSALPPIRPVDQLQLQHQRRLWPGQHDLPRR